MQVWTPTKLKSIHMQQMLQHPRVQLLWLKGKSPCIDLPNPPTGVSVAWHQTCFGMHDAQLELHISDAFEDLRSAENEEH